MDEKLNNNNLKVFGDSAKEIDTLISLIESDLVQFTNSPYGSEEVVLYFVQQAYQMVKYLNKL